MKRLFQILFLVTVSVLFMNTGCSKKNVDNESTLARLYSQYKNGQIDECNWNGKKVYSAGLNAYDAGTEIYDEAGVKIGACYYATNQVDAVCKELSDCETVYRCDNHITREPAVDKYDLGK